ncbi:MAG: hypothetical protein WCC60_04115, partial [Ilumatobacteraceae bacterium]
VISHPETFGTFLIDAAAGGGGFEELAGAAGDALAALAGVIRDATSAALSAFGDRFNPSFTVKGALQPTLLGMPLGSPVAGGELFIDRHGLFLSVKGSLVQIGQSTMGLMFPPFAPVIDAALTVATLGISDEIEMGARLPFGGIIDSLIGGGDLPTFQPLDPNWAVTFTGSISVLGFEGAELSGIAFLGGQETFLNSRVQKLYEQPPGTPVNQNLIPITTKEHFDQLVRHGGILITASLRVPRLITQPAEQLKAFPPPPENPLDYLAWLDDVARTATQTDTPARIQYFIPGISGVTDGDSAVEWAKALYLEGVWDGDLLGLDLGQATMALTPAGLEVKGKFPLAGVEATATLNTALLDGGARLPSAGIDISLDTARITAALQQLGVPSSFQLPANATGGFRAFTPGFDPQSSDPFRRNGGIEVSAQLGSPGLIGSVGFSFAVTPRAGGVDVHGTAFANRVGPVAGVTINNATIDLDIVGGVVTVGIAGSANVLGATATVNGQLAGDLTGSLTFTFASGASARMDLAGAAVTGTATLTLTRVNGVLRGSLAVRGSATLPSWLATASGRTTLTVAGCVDTAGDMEVAISVPALAFGPDKLVRIGKAPGTVTLPPSTAGCALPLPALPASADGPLFRLRKVGNAVTSVVNGSLEFTAAGTSIAGLTVAGSFDTGTGTASLAVGFTAGKMALGGFDIGGSGTGQGASASGTVTIAPGTFSMTVDGRLTIPGLLTNAVVTGAADQRGISHLGVSVGSLNLSPLTISNASLAIDRTIPLNGPAVYRLTAGADADFTGIGSMRIDGTLDSAGNGSLAVAVPSLTIGRAQITNGAFAI